MTLRDTCGAGGYWTSWVGGDRGEGLHVPERGVPSPAPATAIVWDGPELSKSSPHKNVQNSELPPSVSIPGHWPLVYTAGALARPSPAQPLAPLQSLPMRCCVWRAAKCLAGCQGPPQDQIRSRPLLSLPQRLCPAPRIAEHTGPPSSLLPLPVVVLSPQVHPGALQGPAVEGPLSTGDGAQSSQTDPWARSMHP